MNHHSLLAAALLSALCAPVWAVNKCTGPDGRVAYQNEPCLTGKSEALTVRPAAGMAPPAPPPSEQSLPPSSSPMTEAERIEAQFTQSQKDRRKRELEETYVPQARGAVNQHRASCADKQKQLEASQYAYKQNLFGKTHAAQMASEMAAAAATCDTKDRQLTERLNALRKECETLKCRKPQP